jgi:hypothetical protein
VGTVAAANFYPIDDAKRTCFDMSHAPVATIILEVAMPRRFAFLCVLLLTLSASAVAQQTTAETSLYTVDGLALYGHVRFESQAYREYQCSPSDKFPGFTWCHKEKTEKTKRDEITLANSILHSQDGTAVYINRYIEPAFFGPNEVHTELDRLSAKFGEHPHEIRMPQREGLPNAVIAVWGKIQLHQLSSAEVATVASGGRHDGILVSFLGDLERSAKAGVPVYQLTGGAGFLWAATFRGDSKGVLRFLTIDASQLASPNVASINRPSTQPTQPCILAPPGLGFSVRDGKYLITPEAFDINTDVANSETPHLHSDTVVQLHQPSWDSQSGG